MSEVLVKKATASLQPAVPTVIIVTATHTMSIAPSEPFASSGGNEVFVEASIDASFGTYTTEYANAPYVKGMLVYQSLSRVDGLSELATKNGDPMALKSTTGAITCSVSVPAIDPSTNKPDTTLTYDLDFSFTDAGQTLTNSD